MKTSKLNLTRPFQQQAIPIDNVTKTFTFEIGRAHV